MSREDIKDLDVSNEMNLLYEELGKTNELYDEIKGHYDVIKNSRSGANLKFIQDQTSNLISLKSNKVSIIQQIINAKKVKSETDIKVAKAIKDLESDLDGSDSNLKPLLENMYDLILKGDKKNLDKLIEENKSSSVGSQKNDEELDDLIEKRLQQENKDEEVVEPEINEIQEIKEERYIFVIDVEGNYYCYDNVEEAIVENPDIPDSPIVKFAKDDDGMDIGIDEDGNIYEVVEFTEE
ncbi:hypothetical protein Bp8pS_209 [Bacillus phage vB_BpuM-BpSp]|nr:hypothetical protein Bp8pS_209 [Bacillus phage vB_BpuM-BpSp]